MSRNKSFYSQILREYDKRRTLAKKELEKRREMVYSAYPQIAEIDKECETIGIKATKAVLQKPENMALIVEELETRHKQLLEKKKELMSKSDFPEDFLVERFKCEICKDTGYIETEMCKCFRQSLIEKAYDMSNIKDILKVENFDNFDIRYYSSEEIKGEGISPENNIKRILNRCLRYVRDFDEECAHLFLYGKSGLGKTFLCHCIAKELLDAGKTVLYITAFQLFRLIEQNKFNRDELEIEQQEYLESILECDLLIIDDLGTEFSTILSSAELFNIINSRLLEKKPLIISTNLSPTDLIAQYSDRIVSRIQGNFAVLKFLGNDIRIIKKYGRRN